MSSNVTKQLPPLKDCGTVDFLNDLFDNFMGLADHVISARGNLSLAYETYTAQVEQGGKATPTTPPALDTTDGQGDMSTPPLSPQPLMSIDVPIPTVDKRLLSSSRPPIERSASSNSASSGRSSQRSATSPRSTSGQRRSPTVCNFCLNNARCKGMEEELRSEWSSHRLHNYMNEVVCPVLSQHVCPVCSQTGTRAHTIRYCQVKKRRELGM